MARVADLLSPNQRKKYLAGLKGAEREARAAEIVHRREHRSNKPFKTDEGQETHRSSHAAAFERKYGRQAHDVADAAKLTGIPKRILDEVYARGLAAWQTGHRPGASQHAWGLARVYSFATGGPTSRTADRDLAGLVSNPADQTHIPPGPVAAGDYPLAGRVVSGLEVSTDVPDLDSISASLDAYEVLKGIREDRKSTRLNSSH